METGKVVFPQYSGGGPDPRVQGFEDRIIALEKKVKELSEIIVLLTELPEVER